MTKKMTKREMYVAMMNKYAFNAEEVAFIEHEIELLDKKKSGERKPTATQVANIGIKETILEVLAEADRPLTITEIGKAHEELSTLTGQKISSMVSQLVKEFKVVRIEEKRKAYFKIA